LRTSDWQEAWAATPADAFKQADQVYVTANCRLYQACYSSGLLLDVQHPAAQSIFVGAVAKHLLLLSVDSRSVEQHSSTAASSIVPWGLAIYAASGMPVVLYKWGGHSGLPSLTAASLQAEVWLRSSSCGSSSAAAGGMQA
jgi:hypothetical protein